MCLIIQYKYLGSGYWGGGVYFPQTLHRPPGFMDSKDLVNGNWKNENFSFNVTARF